MVEAVEPSLSKKSSDEMRFLSHGNQSLNDGSYSPQ